MEKLNREFLKSLGITEKEQLDSIMSVHGDVIEDTKTKAQTKLDNLQTKYEKDTEALKSKAETLQEKIDNMPKPDPNDGEWKKKYEDLSNKMADFVDKSEYDKIKGEFDTYKANTDAENIERRKNDSLRKRILNDNCNPKYADIVVEKTIKLAELDKDGDIDGYDELMKPVKEQYAEWFEVEFRKTHEPASNTPNNNSVINPFAKESRNLQAQTELFRKDPTLARQMAESAGVKLTE